jgi:hypothetical protein
MDDDTQHTLWLLDMPPATQEVRQGTSRVPRVPGFGDHLPLEP